MTNTNNNKLNLKNIVISSLMCLLPAIISLLIWDRLPEEIATSFDFKGDAIEYMPKFQAIMGVSVYLLFFHIFMILTIKFDPLKNNNSAKIKNKIIYLMPILSNVVIGLIIMYSLDFNIDINRIVFLFISILFAILGNFLPKCKKNYTIGIRTPWTLNSEDNWYYTHRISGKIWFYASIIGIINALVLNNIIIFFIILAVLCIAPMWISFDYFRKYEQKYEQNNDKGQLNE